MLRPRSDGITAEYSKKNLRRNYRARHSFDKVLPTACINRSQKDLMNSYSDKCEYSGNKNKVKGFWGHSWGKSKHRTSYRTRQKTDIKKPPFQVVFWISFLEKSFVRYQTIRVTRGLFHPIQMQVLRQVPS